MRKVVAFIGEEIREEDIADPIAKAARLEMEADTAEWRAGN